MNKLPKAKRQRLILVMLITVIVLVGLWLGLINLQRQGLKDLAGRIEAKQSELNLMTKALATQKQLEEQLTTASGELGKDRIRWAKKGFLGGYSSPVVDGNRLYQIDNGSNLAAHRTSPPRWSRRRLWARGRRLPFH